MGGPINFIFLGVVKDTCPLRVLGNIDFLLVTFPRKTNFEKCLVQAISPVVHVSRQLDVAACCPPGATGGSGCRRTPASPCTARPSTSPTRPRPPVPGGAGARGTSWRSRTRRTAAAGGGGSGGPRGRATAAPCSGRSGPSSTRSARSTSDITGEPT